MFIFSQPVSALAPSRGILVEKPWYRANTNSVNFATVSMHLTQIQSTSLYRFYSIRDHLYIAIYYQLLLDWFVLKKMSIYLFNCFSFIYCLLDT